jgi:hypothetical protein
VSPAATPAATPVTPRSVRISFLPPPLEGKISLGIYNPKGELVRVLHEEASFDDFTIGADALVTKWDGKDNAGNDLPAGEYHARGFLVGTLKVENSETNAAPAPEANAAASIQVKLMPNPLGKNAGATVDLGVGLDDKHVFLKTADGLPLFTLSPKTNLSGATIRKNGDKAVDILFAENGTGTHLLVSNVDKMMAFDCGDLELK